REAQIKPQVTFATYLIFLTFLALVFDYSVNNLGLIGGTINFVALMIIGCFALFGALRMGVTRLDGLLMRTPVIGPIYERFFRRSTTYFQHDTRIVLLKLLDEVVKAYVDAETAA